MNDKSLEEKRRAEQYRLYIKFAVDDITDLNVLEEIYKTIHQSAKENTV